tara:strand:+ start:651 stop:1112 length:462 start_codon:yes stop_codon:yes gene_type:complete
MSQNRTSSPKEGGRAALNQSRGDNEGGRAALNQSRGDNAAERKPSPKKTRVDSSPVSGKPKDAPYLGLEEVHLSLGDLSRNERSSLKGDDLMFFEEKGDPGVSPSDSREQHVPPNSTSTGRRAQLKDMKSMSFDSKNSRHLKKQYVHLLIFCL